MITGVVKNKIDKIWDDIAAGGITNPITVIEQLTYLMFVRSLDEKELSTENLESSLSNGKKLERIFPQTAEGQLMRWSKFKHKTADEIFRIVKDLVFPFIKRLGGKPGSSAFAKYMDDAIFMFPTPAILQKVITGLDDLYETDLKQTDIQGDLYEYMLNQLSSAGKAGSFRTPGQIRQMMVELVEPNYKMRICDPACGTAGFLISAIAYIRKHYEKDMKKEDLQWCDRELLSGFDMDKTMLRISAMNLMLHSVTEPTLEYKDSVSKANTISGVYDLILANPPFSGTIDKEGIHEGLKQVVNTKKTELLFVALFLRMLKKGGRCACIVPDGVLFGSSKAHQALRKELIENHKLEAVISMPSGVFKPYAGVSTAVLVFTKTGAGGTDKVWFYDMQADGFSLDDKRNPVEENDIPDIVSRFHALAQEETRQRTDKSFFVPKQEIAENDYDLSITKYKKIEYIPKIYPPTSTLLDDLAQLQQEIDKDLTSLKGLL